MANPALDERRKDNHASIPCYHGCVKGATLLAEVVCSHSRNHYSEMLLSPFGNKTPAHLGEWWLSLSYSCLCHSRQDYSNVIYLDIKSSAVRKLQLVQNLQQQATINTSNLSSVSYTGFPYNIEASSVSWSLSSRLPVAWANISQRLSKAPG